MDNLKADLLKKSGELKTIKEETQNEVNQLNHQLKKKYWIFNLVDEELKKTQRELDALPFEPKKCEVCNKEWKKKLVFIINQMYVYHVLTMGEVSYGR